MKQKNQSRWITQTALMLALLIALQAITKSLGQLVAGSFVISALIGGGVAVLKVPVIRKAIKK